MCVLIFPSKIWAKKYTLYTTKYSSLLTLAGVAQLVGVLYYRLKVEGSIPSQDVYGREPIDVSLSH